MRFLLVLSALFLLSCHNEAVLPKPKAQLRLDYPTPEYQKVNLKYFSFDKSNQAQLEKINDQRINLVYPQMKAKIYLTYNKIDHNLDKLLRDAEKFTYEHTVKADEIFTRDFINTKDSVYATLNMVTGNAASQIQFHVTDSTRNFLDGSLYFYAQPNFDSIMPAVKYLQTDINKLLESFRWN